MGDHVTETRHFPRNKRTAAFWTLMGPVFASGAIRRELTTLHDDPDTDEWFARVEGKADVLWFGCLRVKGDAAELCHYWVRPEDREKSVSKIITDALMGRATELGLKRVHITAGPALVADLAGRGFTETKARGKYRQMEKTFE